MPELVVIDVDGDSVVERFEISAAERIPSRGHHVWVSGNGDVAFWVRGVEHDYDAGEVRLLCEKQPAKGRRG